MRGALALSLVLSAPAGGAHAQEAPEPPTWAYLAECSAVFGAATRATESYSGGDPDLIAKAGVVSERFLARAVEAAGEAGEADPAADVESIMGYLQERWDNRIDRIFSVKSNLDWFDYCRRLGLEAGVLPLAD